VLRCVYSEVLWSVPLSFGQVESWVKVFEQLEAEYWAAQTA